MAVFPFFWGTDGSGTITGGSWTGDGVVQPNVTPGTFPPLQAHIAVEGFTSTGTIVIDNMGGNLFTSGRLNTDPISATHTISLSGGTADIRLANSATFDGGASLFNSVGLTNFQGVDEITWTVRFSEPIAGRNDALTSLTTRPMGSALGLVNQGGAGLNDFTVGMEYTEIWSALTPTGPFSPGVPSGAAPIVAPGIFGSPAAGATSFTSTAFPDYAASTADRFLLVRGYDVVAPAGYTAADAPLVYMTEMTWTIRRTDNGQFTNGTLFVMSMDGQQHSNVLLVPEPSRVVLMAAALLGLCLVRRRRA